MNFETPEAAIKHAQESPDASVYAWFLGYASGMTEARYGYDRSLQTAKDDYSRGYSAGWCFILGAH